MPGPPPKPDSQRRRRNAPMANTLRLPAAGRPGKAPVWPLTKADVPQVGRREATVWAELWKKPQAVAWEAMHCSEVVARYVRFFVQVEGGGGSREENAEARQLEDRLGIGPLAMQRLRWSIVEEDEPATALPSNVLSIRERLVANE